MAHTATLAIEKPNPDKEAWELFEVGSFDEVIRLAEDNPDSQFLSHLGMISKIENGEILENYAPKGMSILSSMLEAYVNFKNHRLKEASNQLEIYYKNKNALISYPFVRLSHAVFTQSGKKELALGIIKVYKKKFLDHAFLKEEAILYYELKKYEDLINLYSAHPKEMNDAELHRVIGMAMLFMGKNKDAEILLEKIPGKLKLPSFEEKRRDYETIYKKIGSMESIRSSLQPKELEDMGFAYLFHNEFDKAESVFTDLVNQLRQ